MISTYKDTKKNWFSHSSSPNLLLQNQKFLQNPPLQRTKKMEAITSTAPIYYALIFHILITPPFEW